MKYVELIEGRDAPLYHGTYLGAALRILATDTIEARSHHESARMAGLGGMPSFDDDKADLIRGVSLTRSRAQALHFDFGPIVFELDQRKLARTNKLIPFAYWGAGHLSEPSVRGHRPKGVDPNEAEEFCVGAIKPATRYIIAIYYRRQQYNQDNRNFSKETLQPLLDHPLLRVI